MFFFYPISMYLFWEIIVIQIWLILPVHNDKLQLTLSWQTELIKAFTVLTILTLNYIFLGSISRPDGCSTRPGSPSLIQLPSIQLSCSNEPRSRPQPNLCESCSRPQAAQQCQRGTHQENGNKAPHQVSTAFQLNTFLIYFFEFHKVTMYWIEEIAVGNGIDWLVD